MKDFDTIETRARRRARIKQHFTDHGFKPPSDKQIKEYQRQCALDLAGDPKADPTFKINLIPVN